MDREQITLASRRRLLRVAASAGAFVAVGGGLAACGSKAPNAVCSTPDKLTDAQIDVRTSFAYTEASQDPSKVCGGCAFFHAAADQTCGECELLKGPVNRAGHCTSWSRRSA